MAGRPTEFEQIVARQVFIRGANRPFGEFTLADARERADELRAATGWGPTARVAAVALAWRELTSAMERAGAGTVAELDPDVGRRAGAEAVGRHAGRRLRARRGGLILGVAAWTRAFTRSERLRLAGFGGAVAGLHVLGWGLYLYYSRGNPTLAGLGALAYTFGLRHAFDADHIAAIDNTTRKLLQEGRRSAGRGVLLLARPLDDRVRRSPPASRSRAETVQLHHPGVPALRRLRRRERVGRRSCGSSAS